MAEEVRKLMNDPEISQYSDSKEITAEESREICSGKYPWFMVFSDDGKLIGVTALLRSNGTDAEMCILLKKEVRGKGLGKEIVDRLCVISFLRFHLKRIFARILPENRISRAFFEKCGFQKTDNMPKELMVPQAGENVYYVRELTQPKLALSVIIPMRNSAEWIEECIQSLEDIPYEIIAVDDMSDDATVKIVNSISEKNDIVHMIQPETRRFAGGCRNDGLQYASGSYVLFLDSDDRIFDVKILKQMVEAACITRADVIRTAEAAYYSDSITIRRLPGGFTGIVDDHMRPHAFCQQIPLWMCMFKKEFIEENGIRCAENVRSYEDNLFSFMAAAKVGSVVTVPGILTMHRIRETSLSHISDRQIQESFLEVALQQYRFAEEQQLLPRYSETMEQCFFHFVFLSALYARKTVGSVCDQIILDAVIFLKERFPDLANHLEMYHLQNEEKKLFLTMWNSSL